MNRPMMMVWLICDVLACIWQAIVERDQPNDESGQPLCCRYWQYIIIMMGIIMIMGAIEYILYVHMHRIEVDCQWLTDLRYSYSMPTQCDGLLGFTGGLIY